VAAEAVEVEVAYNLVEADYTYFGPDPIPLEQPAHVPHIQAKLALLEAHPVVS
jgi:hypothetical protein